MALAFDHVTDAPAPKRFEVVMDVGELAEEDCNVFRLRQNPLGFGIDKAGVVQHLIVQPIGEAFAFETTSGLGADVSIRRNDFAQQRFWQRLTVTNQGMRIAPRSEERRVGKEWRSRVE